MALDKNRLGDNITAAIQAENSSDGLVALTGTHLDMVRRYWRIIADEIIKEFKLHGDIVLLEADIKINKGSLTDSHDLPLTAGQGENEAVTLEQKIT